VIRNRERPACGTSAILPKVLITGANGEVGRFLVSSMQGGFDLRLAVWDLRRGATDPALQAESTCQRFDIVDLEAFTEALRGMDAVVHLAGEREVQADWESLRGPNIDGVYNLYEGARRAGVRKVVFASSNHVTGRLDHKANGLVTGDTQLQPDSLYGVTKAFGETLGRYAADYFDMSVICLRLGWVLERPHNETALRMWLSPGDLGRLVVSALRSDRPYGIYYGASANRRCPWDLTQARNDLGYRPEDDSERYAAKIEQVGIDQSAREG